MLVFDVETTGTDRRRDQIIELCVQYGLGEELGGEEPAAASRIWRFKPSVPIHPGAQAVHGISMEDLASCPPFSACADEILRVFANVDVVVGYNLAFDIDFLQSEYERLRSPGIDFSGKTIVDAFRLWQRCEPRSLQHAHKRFVGDEFGSAHSAKADVAATARVLQGMLRQFGLDDRNWGDIATVCDPNRSSWVGPSRHLQWDQQGMIVLSFGKHAGTPLHVLAAGPDASYLLWIIEKDFPVHVVEICRRVLDMRGEDFLAWARRRYGQAAPTVAPPFVANQADRRG